MSLLNFFYGSQQSAPSSSGGNLFSALIPFILVFVIFYLLIILPSRKRQKKHQLMVENLQPGDKVLTTGGIYGTVMGVQKDKIELKIASNVKVDVAKSAVAAVLTPREVKKD
ncbi:MAG: preprotein translocase subunit YajC [Candidatus Aminicenantes bacterium 4484_214]|nr:MAG: preprotein translocase subunit YajC [Candidatus Aminicenantes bacterium 4484_214]HDJ23231.1 preprotein translocase subunit YajC [Candidatus Aminicenantes bacterium]